MLPVFMQLKCNYSGNSFQKHKCMAEASFSAYVFPCLKSENSIVRLFESKRGEKGRRKTRPKWVVLFRPPKMHFPQFKATFLLLLKGRQKTRPWPNLWDASFLFTIEVFLLTVSLFLPTVGEL